MPEEQEVRIPTTQEFLDLKRRIDAVGDVLRTRDLSAGVIKARIYRESTKTPLTPPPT